MDCITYLLKVLATYKAYEYNTHIMHWQVTGPINKAFHALMQEYYEHAETVMDDIAERVRMLEGSIPTKMCELMGMSEINFLSTTPDMQAGISINIKMHEHMIMFLKQGIEMATEKKDYYTEDILRGLCAWHEKQKRLIESRMGKSLSDKPLIKNEGQEPNPESD